MGYDSICALSILSHKENPFLTYITSTTSPTVKVASGSNDSTHQACSQFDSTNTTSPQLESQPRQSLTTTAPCFHLFSLFLRERGQSPNVNRWGLSPPPQKGMGDCPHLKQTYSYQGSIPTTAENCRKMGTVPIKLCPH